tara:strand:- start:444 stop:701 length:258 start_codon:yes stop_codon:yes gene_type:complete
MNSGEKKYSEEAVEIIKNIQQIRTAQEGIAEKIDDIHRQNGKQWDKIDQNKDNITKLDTKMKIFGSLILGLSPIIGGVVAVLLGK